MALQTFSFSTTADEVATSLADQIAGKNVLVTGTSINGLGFETARAIAKYANLVIITGYNAERLKLSEDAIKKEIPSANIRCLVLDLSSMAAVRAAAAEVNAYPEPLHVLINNAAAVIGPFKLTVDGLESQMAINHVGHFLLTKLLMPKLLASKTTVTPSFTPRVVFLSSHAHIYCDGVDLAAIEHPSAETYDIGQGYYRSKVANILTTRELARRGRGVLNAFSVHPGAIYTNITEKEESREYLQSVGHLDADGKPARNPRWNYKTIPQGAATTVVAAFDPRLEDKSGAYLADCVEDNAGVAPHSSDPVMAEKLWVLTEKLIGEPFVLPFA
ncbi:Short-chain dehydrogenase/reductase family protein [Mycena venus]|uniref:Short-chain dehydrogenase/reductase family protein n=1 Tax=Mycena venus TaxID=2733690 RepID=A0A8H6YCR7_9AGAR|nr:Short-chain dehydrogenase/reductase family protein [Mycena venus]